MKHSLFCLILLASPLVQSFESFYEPKKFLTHLAVDTKCFKDLERVLNSSSAPEMLDAWAKSPPAGLLYGNTVDFGNFDQCLNLNGEIKGRYCTLSVDAENEIFDRPLRYDWIDFHLLPINHTNAASITISLGICLPSSCRPKEIYDAFSAMTTKMPVSLANYNQEDYCVTDDELERVPFTKLDVVTISLFAFIAVLTILSTIYELWMLKRGKMGHPILQLFSIVKNGRRIFTSRTYKSPEVLNCINGIRVLSLMWIIVAHSYLTLIMVPLVNKDEIGNWVTNYQSMIILGSSVAVDTFLLLSGMLVSWVILWKIHSGSLSILKLYVHRYLRLTPAFAVLVLVCCSLFKHFGSGPLWTVAANDVAGPCERNWWKALLFVHNYASPEDICVGHSWYLAVDMQLFLIAPFVVYSLYRWKYQVVPVLGVALVGSMVASFVTIYMNGLKVSAMSNIINGRNVLKGTLIYYPTHIRMGAWLIGIILGYLLFTQRNKTIILRTWTLFCGWTFTIITCTAVVFGNYPFQQEQYNGSIVLDAIFESIIRVAWSTAVAWIVFACVHGYGGPVKYVLSFAIWKPLGKISYSAYLVHYPIQMLLMGTMRTSKYFSDVTAVQKFLGELMVTLIVAVAWTLTFEMPIVELEEYILQRKTQQEGQAEVLIPEPRE